MKQTFTFYEEEGYKFKKQPIEGHLKEGRCGYYHYPLMFYRLLQLDIPEIIKAICPSDFATEALMSKYSQLTSLIPMFSLFLN